MATGFKKIKKHLHWAGPLLLSFLGLVWLLQGYSLLPQLLDVAWLGAILLSIGIIRLAMYFLGYY